MKNVKQWAGLIALSGAVCFSQGVMAAAGDNISNVATIDYSVAGINQEDIESSPEGNSTPGDITDNETIFVEDQVINFVVQTQDTSEVNVAPAANPTGSPAEYLSYTIYNVSSGDSSNDTRGFNSNGTVTVTLAAFDEATAQPNPVTSPNSTEDDTFDSISSNSCKVYSDQSGTEITEIEIAPGGSVDVYVACAIPAEIDGKGTGNNLVNDDVAVVSLVAAAKYGYDSATDISALDNTEANTIDGVEYVFADGMGTDDAADYDGEHSDRSAYRIFKADLTVTKTVTVVSDPICDAQLAADGPGSCTPKMVPGAIVEYTIVVGNDADAATATNVLITDVVDANMVYEAGTLTGTNSSPGGADVTDESGAPTLLVTCDTLPELETCTMVFQAEVQYD